ncbi:hypothetical protein GCM10022243_02410 [Saccharothrix violaceirubra]|uniref:NACHT domain-containing protein n=1 Tax=Saccharothrix violaceirubra TaxID=413306 RepID=A0A7W7T3Q3_9PSEU|nr:DUF4062 domain-containing protein [Saccharothrix violaceirubra]MBB4965998.1 hypothetical protein [Saccharothrix violaceirubra]
MARVYVSSTYSDLQEHREAVRTAIRRMGHEDVAMEYYVAEDTRPLNRCLEDVRASDVYVVIMAWRYGFIPEGHSESITELEYRAAIDAKIPVLAFVLSEDQPWLPKLVEHSKQVDRFRTELMNSHLVGLFTTTDDLARRVAESLHVRPADATVDWDVYRQAVVDRYEFVRLSVIAGTRDRKPARIPLTEVFVPQQLLPGRPEYDVPEDEEVEAVPADAVRVVGATPRQVLLGGPGSGKSTLLHATMLTLCHPSAPPPGQGLADLPVPFLVELRRYALSGADDFVAYLENTVQDELGVRLGSEAIVDLLSSGGAVVLFDGLDEIVEPTARARAVDRFRTFTTRFPDARVIVSSRIVGYDDTELGLAGFDHHTLLDFGLREITEFVPRWYRHYTVENDDRDAAGLIRRITENPRLRELAGNPLLLTMMAIIYKHQDLPEKRWQLYARCTAVLLEDWDVKRKKIDTRETLRLDFPIGADQKAEMLQRVAVRMLADAHSGEVNAIPYGPLRATIADYLTSQYAKAPAEARALSTEIINHLRERTHILAETGDGVFGFVHRTFMEYFAAGHVLGEFNHRKADYDWLKVDVFGARRNDDGWREPLLLLIGMLSGQGSPVREIVESLLRHNDALLFAADCLAETGQVAAADQRWASGLLDKLVETVRDRPKRMPASFIKDIVASFCRLATFVPMSHRTPFLTEELSQSRSTNSQAAGWEMSLAFSTNDERRHEAIESLHSGSSAVRRSAVAMLARDWPGDEEVYDHLIGTLETDGSATVCENVLNVVAKNWPMRRESLLPIHLAVSILGIYRIAEHLSVEWKGNIEALMVLVYTTEHGIHLGDFDFYLTIARRLRSGWGHLDDANSFLNDIAKNSKNINSALASAIALYLADHQLHDTSEQLHKLSEDALEIELSRRSELISAFIAWIEDFPFSNRSIRTQIKLVASHDIQTARLRLSTE